MSAAVFGHWLEKAGPRKAGVAAAILLGVAVLMITSLGVSFHQLWLIWLRGMGVIGGIGLGTWLYFSSININQMVSRQKRFSNRYGNYGIWWGSYDWHASWR